MHEHDHSEAQLRRIVSALDRPASGTQGAASAPERESDLRHQLLATLDRHPAWSWLRHLEPVPPLVSARLITRLDAVRARNPLVFWTRCGLDFGFTFRYACSECDLGIALAAAESVDPRHLDPDTKLPCPGTLLAQFPGAAERAESRGQRRDYSRSARQSCLRIGGALSAHPGPYRVYFRSVRARIRRDDPTLNEARADRYSRTRLEQLFLIHLWMAWRQETGLAADATLAAKLALTPDQHNPWAMTIPDLGG